jgi:hypothetical protein
MARTADGEVLERGATKELNIQKHKVIARAFAKRKLLHDEGRLSISFRSSHGDPIGKHNCIFSLILAQYMNLKLCILEKCVIMLKKAIKIHIRGQLVTSDFTVGIILVYW